MEAGKLLREEQQRTETCPPSIVAGAGLSLVGLGGGEKERVSGQ
jgi:hypothetical protein